jgi:4-alpha-glucanotransferase
MSRTSPFARRTFGVLLHPSSLAGREPIGTLGAEAHRWVDWLASTGAGLWQVLPLTFTGEGDSPYFSPAAFAGNPWLIDLQELVSGGLLASDELSSGLSDEAPDGPVEFDTMRAWKRPLLHRAAEEFLGDPAHEWRNDYERFVADTDWLDDACHFIALKRVDPDTPWWDWDEPIRRRDPAAVAASAHEVADLIERERVLQFIVDRQWGAVRRRANAAGIAILGDVPIYVAPDSADVWANQELFELDDDGRPTLQSGVPPDYFSETGQLWGNPIYRWDVMAGHDFDWWMRRLRRALDQADVVRIDHFRGLSAYWAVPADADTAVDGEWFAGPGQAFVDAVRRAFPDLPIVAEDLGDLDDAVYQLRDRNDLVGMRVLQFGLADRTPNEHHPDHVDERCVVYTGTHDNDTLAAWWEGLSRRRRERVRDTTGMPARVRTRRAVRWIVGVAMRTKALAAVVPLQDLLALGAEARMNTPGTSVGNWAWRMPAGCLTAELAADLERLAADADRA